MGELKNKAKTSYEIFLLWNEQVDKRKWVPLEDAEAEIQKLEDANEAKRILLRQTEEHRDRLKDEVADWEKQQKDDYAIAINKADEYEKGIQKLQRELEQVKHQNERLEEHIKLLYNIQTKLEGKVEQFRKWIESNITCDKENPNQINWCRVNSKEIIEKFVGVFVEASK